MEEKGAGWLKAAAVYQGVMTFSCAVGALRALKRAIETADPKIILVGLALLGLVLVLGFATHGLVKRRLDAWHISVVIAWAFLALAVVGIIMDPRTWLGLAVFGGQLTALALGRRAISTAPAP